MFEKREGEQELGFDPAELGGDGHVVFIGRVRSPWKTRADCPKNMDAARQSGLPGFRIARLEIHGQLINAARDDAQLILNRDPTLTSPRGEALRFLLYLFERDEAIRLLRAG